MFAPAKAYENPLELSKLVSGAFEYAKRNRTKVDTKAMLAAGQIAEEEKP